ncbi:MAG: HEXXH motif-containing putative peptide modification protein [Planctomycetia bacterium]
MRSLLAESIEHIHDRGAAALDVNFAPVLRVAAGLRAGHRYSPAVFGLYKEAVEAIADDDLPAASDRLQRFGAERPLDTTPEIVALGDAALAPYRALLLAELGLETSLGCGVRDPEPAAVADFTTRLASARRLMAQAVPDLAAEFDALTTQIVLVGSDPKAAMQFDGGSSYMLWGGLFLNIAFHPNDVALVEVLAHESAHMLLFGYAADEPLVNNDDEPRYASPLRIDPRPMDGIYHATYVSARMHWAMSQLIASGVLDDAGRRQAEEARAADKRNFEDGYAVVAAHGDLTATGAAVMQAARSAMDAV